MQMSRGGVSLLRIDTCSIHMPASLLGPNKKLVAQAQHTLDQIGRGLATMLVASGMCVVLPNGVVQVVNASQSAFYFGLIAFATFSCLKVTQESMDQYMGCDGRCIHPAVDPLAIMAMAKVKAHANAAITLSPGEPRSERGTASTRMAPPSNPRLPLLRKRVLEHLKQPFPVVNRVNGETRKRRSMTLFKSRVRVGKALLRPVGNSGKESDFYMVRVDCSTPDDKHMNPVVMWDVTATFDDFKRLEQQLKKELKAKKASTNSTSPEAAALSSVKVPHLSNGIPFLQRSLTQHVLNARRDKLQVFIDDIVQCQHLADLKAMRQFCQVL